LDVALLPVQEIHSSHSQSGPNKPLFPSQPIFAQKQWVFPKIQETPDKGILDFRSVKGYFTDESLYEESLNMLDTYLPGGSD